MSNDEDPLKIIKYRYAKGEISKKEYLKMMDNLKERKDHIEKRTNIENGTKINGGWIATIIVAILIIAGISYVLLINNETQQYQTSPSTIYTTYTTTTIPQIHTLTLFSKGQVFSINPSYYEFVNFSIPQSAYSINITGSYTSQGKVEVAILTPAQYGAFTQNPSSIASTQYYYGDTQGATINAVLPAGQYSLVFYDPGIFTQDTITVINPIVVEYTK